jgi:hypothetical protein
MKYGQCKFCERMRELVESHIIPRSLYPKNENGDIRKKAISVTEAGPARDIANGISDRNLVCRECEDYFDPYDSYATKIFRQLSETPVLTAAGGYRYREVFTYDRIKLQLFFLSLLWRMHATSIPAFRQVSLGPHANIVREMIKSGNAGKESDYRAMLFGFRSDPDLLFDISQVTFSPIRRRTLDGTTFYELGLFGYLCWIGVDKRPAGPPLSLSNVMKGPPLYIIERDPRQSPFPKFMWDAVNQTKEFYLRAERQREERRISAQKNSP